ncbi:hypothetical protein BJ508DRAFT_320697 [Ascobolus immersus RN42]|uniref:Uncharacterized protein n=1 Tax=Ascobolus immersus RN42 TaxID=1160509 RepID=A0A3N4IU20_ASCIM|nr:hypothetical protein BJ508DRAFT_320697 [Ascobolus immersus RN42]
MALFQFYHGSFFKDKKSFNQPMQDLPIDDPEQAPPEPGALQPDDEDGGQDNAQIQDQDGVGQADAEDAEDMDDWSHWPRLNHLPFSHAGASSFLYNLRKFGRPPSQSFSQYHHFSLHANPSIHRMPPKPKKAVTKKATSHKDTDTSNRSTTTSDPTTALVQRRSPRPRGEDDLSGSETETEDESDLSEESQNRRLTKRLLRVKSKGGVIRQKAALQVYLRDSFKKVYILNKPFVTGFSKADRHGMIRETQDWLKRERGVTASWDDTKTMLRQMCDDNRKSISTASFKEAQKVAKEKGLPPPPPRKRGRPRKHPIPSSTKVTTDTTRATNQEHVKSNPAKLSPDPVAKTSGLLVYFSEDMDLHGKIEPLECPSFYCSSMAAWHQWIRNNFPGWRELADSSILGYSPFDTYRPDVMPKPLMYEDDLVRALQKASIVLFVLDPDDFFGESNESQEKQEQNPLTYTPPSEKREPSLPARSVSPKVWVETEKDKQALAKLRLDTLRKKQTAAWSPTPSQQVAMLMEDQKRRDAELIKDQKRRDQETELEKKKAAEQVAAMEARLQEVRRIANNKLLEEKKAMQETLEREQLEREQAIMERQKLEAQIRQVEAQRQDALREKEKEWELRVHADFKLNEARQLQQFRDGNMKTLVDAVLQGESIEHLATRPEMGGLLRLGTLQVPASSPPIPAKQTPPIVVSLSSPPLSGSKSGAVSTQGPRRLYSPAYSPDPPAAATNRIGPINTSLLHNQVQRQSSGFSLFDNLQLRSDEIAALDNELDDVLHKSSRMVNRNGGVQKMKNDHYTNWKTARTPILIPSSPSSRSPPKSLSSHPPRPRLLTPEPLPIPRSFRIADNPSKHQSPLGHRRIPSDGHSTSSPTPKRQKLANTPGAVATTTVGSSHNPFSTATPNVDNASHLSHISPTTTSPPRISNKPSSTKTPNVGNTSRSPYIPPITTTPPQISNQAQDPTNPYKNASLSKSGVQAHPSKPKRIPTTITLGERIPRDEDIRPLVTPKSTGPTRKGGAVPKNPGIAAIQPAGVSPIVPPANPLVRRTSLRVQEAKEKEAEARRQAALLAANPPPPPSTTKPARASRNISRNKPDPIGPSGKTGGRRRDEF